MSMTENPRPIIPALGKHYACAGDWAYLLLRVAAGLMLTTHVWPKLMAGPAAVAANVMARRGIEPSVPLAYAVFFLETIGALCIILGLFTRVFALAIGIQFLLIVFNAHWGTGLKDFPWNRQGGGWEYPLFWGLIWVAIGLRGGGPYSLDRKLGREL